MQPNRTPLHLIFAAVCVLAAPLARTAAQEPTASSLPASAMLNDTATLNGTVNPGGTETIAWFEWGTIHDEVYSQHTEPLNIGNGTTGIPLTSSLSNLVQGFTYHYRLTASNSFGVVRGREQRFWIPAINFHTPAFITVEPGTFVDRTVAHDPPPEIAAGEYHNLALMADGSVVAWGNNIYGQCTIPASATNVVAVAAGGASSLALRTDGSVVAWGSNSSGHTNVPAHATNVVVISAGKTHGLALREDGSIVAWGLSQYGQTNVPASATNVAAIAAGGAHSLALRADGSVVAWGYNSHGQCNVPADATNVVAVAAGDRRSLVLRPDGSIVAWGQDQYGEGSVPDAATNVTAIAAGGFHNLVLRADGSVDGWGFDAQGQASVPADATDVVAIAAGDYHSLAMRADGSAVAWGRNTSGQCNIPGAIAVDLPLAVEGTVETNMLGTYVLDYSTTNALGAVATATRTVEVAYLPDIATEAATGIGAEEATLQGTANPWAGMTMAWFEYGLGASYGSETPKMDQGNSTNAVPFAGGVSNLLPYMTYHYRAVASNGIGRVNGSDRTFTMSAYSPDTPSLSVLPELFLEQGGSTSVWFTAEPAEVDVRVTCNNPILLPESGLVLGSSSLGIAPDPNHSGSAQITVTANDGMQSASQTFTLTVVPVDPSQLLNLKSQAVSNGFWRLRVQDDGTASTNYMVEYRPELSPTSTWSYATNIVELGGDEYEIDLWAAQGDTGFYRIMGFRMIQGGFDSSETEVEEGMDAAGVVVVFNSIFTGTLNYTWIDETGTTNGGIVEVDGTTAVIPLPAAFLDDDTGIGQLEHLTLQLDAGTGYVQSDNTGSLITIEENDADWKCLIETGGNMLGFTLTMLQDNGAFNGRIQSEDFGFFPTNVLVQLAFAEDSFTAVATDIPLPVFAGTPMGFINHLDLRLDAANNPGETNVGPDRVEGDATLVVKVQGQSSLDAALTGPFILTRPPTAPSTNEVPLQPIP